jgi:P pilus assembly chaperone PapD
MQFLRNFYQRLLVQCAFLVAGVIGISSVAQASQMLQVLPPRIVIEKGRSASLTLVNRNEEGGQYRIFTRNIRTNDFGRFETITEAENGELFADKMLRYSPRQVTVDGQSKQDVRVVVRKPKGLEDGEYRSHLVFRSLPKAGDDADSGGDAISMKFNPTLEITIPVIVRHGDLSAEIGLSDLKVAQRDEEQFLDFTISRDGNRSIYGEVVAWWTPEGDSDAVRIGLAKGISVYYPNQIRHFSLEIPADLKLTQGTVKIEYNEDPTYGGEEKAYIEMKLP